MSDNQHRHPKIFSLKSTVINSDYPRRIYVNVEDISSVEVETDRGRVSVCFPNHHYLFNRADPGIEDLLLELAGRGLATFAEHRLLEAEVSAAIEDEDE